MAGYIWNSFLLFISAIAFLVAFAIWRFQDFWMPYFEDFYYDMFDRIDYWRTGQLDGRYAFLRDQRQGLSSSNFDLNENIESQDNRRGLDDKAKRIIRRIMRRDSNITFDEARVLYTTQQFTRNGIDSEGRPMDPRAVFFS